LALCDLSPLRPGSLPLFFSPGTGRETGLTPRGSCGRGFLVAVLTAPFVPVRVIGRPPGLRCAKLADWPHRIAHRTPPRPEIPAKARARTGGRHAGAKKAAAGGWARSQPPLNVVGTTLVVVVVAAGGVALRAVVAGVVGVPAVVVGVTAPRLVVVVVGVVVVVVGLGVVVVVVGVGFVVVVVGATVVLVTGVVVTGAVVTGM
jgi:hypothetical protein